MIVGANVENASYPVTTCAERVALGTAVTNHGLRRGDIKAIGVATDLDEPCSPCGMCRQALREFSDVRCMGRVDPSFVANRANEKTTTPIYMHTKSGSYVVKLLGEVSRRDPCGGYVVFQADEDQLLPMSFGPETLVRLDQTTKRVHC